MINNQLKIYKKRGLWLGEKTYLKKKRVSTGFCRVARVTDQPGFAAFLFIPVFYLIRTGPTTKFNNYG
jgi:hypothetical protein